MNLKQALKLRNELVTQGKTPEEILQLLGENLKLQGDRVNFLTVVLDLMSSKSENIKRAIVFSLSEGEKIPAHSVQKGEHTYLVEYYPPLGNTNPKQKPRDQKPGRDKGRKKRNPKENRSPTKIPSPVEAKQVTRRVIKPKTPTPESSS